MKHIRNYTCFTAISIIALLCVIFFHPTLSSLIFPFKRQMVLTSFINSIKKTHMVDTQAFWQMREFYYPGSLTVAKRGIPTKPRFSPPKEWYPLYFTSFRSKYITSDEFLVNTSSLSALLDEDIPPSVSYQVIENKNEVILVFIKPIREMITANGFLDYKDKDKKLLQGKYWFVYTIINK